MAASVQWSSQALEILRSRGFRTGGARTAVIELLGQEDCCLTAKEISDRLAKTDQSVGMASVYRALELLDRLKLVSRVDTGEGMARYERVLSSGEHHHHLICEQCGQVEAFEDAPLEAAIATVADKVDFNVNKHEIVLRGRCQSCS